MATSAENKMIDNSPKPNKAGSLALAVVEETKNDVFKKPYPVTGSKRKVDVLDEETYLKEIGRIIQRDFFPDLEKLKVQKEYVEAVENNDICKLREIYSKYSIGRRLPADTCNSPATFETPVMRRIESAESPRQNENTEKEETSSVKAPEKEHSLDEFLKKHTSEDNQSFEEIVEEAEIKKRAKYPWLYKNEGTPALMASTEILAIKDNPANIETWGYKNRNYIMYVPDGVDYTKEEKLEMIKRKKEINHSGTRFKMCPFDDEQNKETVHTIAQCQNRVLEGKIGVDGKELSLFDTPQVNGYDFVKTPSPMPGVNESPLMTWGQIEGTPFRLDGSDTPVRPGLPGPVFKIAEPPMREKLAHALADQVNEKKRDKKQKSLDAAKKQQIALNSPSVTGSPFERFDATTPSTPRLLSSHLKNRVNTDLSLRASPSPRETLSRLRTPKLKSTPSRTPDLYDFTPNSSSLSDADNENLTDNLLNLNVTKRPKAADFFL